MDTTDTPDRPASVPAAPERESEPLLLVEPRLPLREESGEPAPSGQADPLEPSAGEQVASGESEHEHEHEHESEQPTRKRTLWQVVGPFVPWFSLVGGVVGAVWMDRRESQAPLVAAGTAASWVGLVIASLLHRKPSDVQPRQTGAFKRALRFTTFAANQSLVQLSLFFCAPFYAAAFVLTPLEVVFALLFALAVVASLWDPLTEYVMLHPAWGPALLAFSSFVAWNAVLPMLGVPHRLGVWAAAGAVSFAIVLVQVLRGGTQRELGWSVLVAAMLPLLLLIGGVRALPPAPLRVVEAGIGTGVQDRTLVGGARLFRRSPGVLVCFTAIQAPTGLKDQLAHVWRHDGEITHRVPLNVKGGRKRGFRTWSRLPLPARASGKYRCDVVTPLGQTLGSAEATIGE